MENNQNPTIFPKELESNDLNEWDVEIKEDETNS